MFQRLPAQSHVSKNSTPPPNCKMMAPRLHFGGGFGRCLFPSALPNSRALNRSHFFCRLLSPTPPLHLLLPPLSPHFPPPPQRHARVDPPSAALRFPEAGGHGRLQQVQISEKSPFRTRNRFASSAGCAVKNTCCICLRTRGQNRILVSSQLWFEWENNWENRPSGLWISALIQ